MLTIQNLHFSYGSKKVIQGLSLALAPGEIVSLIGVSGSGKTTLFRLIAGSLKAEQGHINLRPQEVSYMRQEDLLLPWRTVLDNLLLFSELGRKKGERPRLEALSLLEQMGLKGCEGMFPETLSGGMRQRLSLARSLLQNRPFLLLDEPFGSLDVLMREELYKLIKEKKKTTLLVTHDFRDALALSDRILVLVEGKIGAEIPQGDGAYDALYATLKKYQ